MFYIKVNFHFVEYVFKTKKDAIMYLVKYLESESFENPVELLKNAKKIQKDDIDIIEVHTFTFKIFKMYEHTFCCLCNDSMSSKNLLECGHEVCVPCLSKLRKNECPVCRAPLSGDIITDEILCNILQRTELDEQEQRDQDQVMALATEMGYNPNELY